MRKHASLTYPTNILKGNYLGLSKYVRSSTQPITNSIPIYFPREQAAQRDNDKVWTKTGQGLWFYLSSTTAFSRDHIIRLVLLLERKF